MGVATGCVCKEYIDFLILLILYLFFFTAASLLFFHFFFFMFFVLVYSTSVKVMNPPRIVTLYYSELDTLP